MCLLSAKTVEEQIMVRPINPIIKGKQNIKGKNNKAKKLNLMLKDLTLGYPTWLSLLSCAVKTVMPFLGGD